MIGFPQSLSRPCKAVSTPHVLRPWRTEFPGLVSASRFGEGMPSPLGPLGASLRQGSGSWTGTAFGEATARAGGQNRRLAQQKGLAAWAARGRPSGGWGFGLKLPLGVKDRGE